MPGHGQIHRHGIALFDTKGFEYIGDRADFAQELCIADLSAFIGLIGFINDRRLEYIELEFRQVGRSGTNVPCRGA